MLTLYIDGSTSLGFQFQELLVWIEGQEMFDASWRLVVDVQVGVYLPAGSSSLPSEVVLVPIEYFLRIGVDGGKLQTKCFAPFDCLNEKPLLTTSPQNDVAIRMIAEPQRLLDDGSDWVPVISPASLEKGAVVVQCKDKLPKD